VHLAKVLRFRSRWDSNPQPAVYKTVALPLSYSDDTVFDAVAERSASTDACAASTGIEGPLKTKNPGIFRGFCIIQTAKKCIYPGESPARTLVQLVPIAREPMAGLSLPAFDG
jgi:hypothetical protein